jgi:hypothetical protein
LADLLQRQNWGACGLWPDDIEWDELTPTDKQELNTACAALGTDPTRVVM